MQRTLVIGYGNVLRADDGLGAAVVEQVDRQDWPGVETRVVQQLHVELIEEMLRFDRIVLVDAGAGGGEISLQRVTASSANGLSSSHHVGPGLLVGLARRLYGKEPAVFLCRVPGESFALREGLSGAALRRVPEAVRVIQRVATKENVYA